LRVRHELREGTDLWAVDQGYVSLTPLRLDLTDHEELKRVTEEMPWTEDETQEGA
jgi:broad specificity polyphosphatase/5'/3'-nucleotidase SurE